MNLLTITMDKDRSLTPSVYSLGVEGDHKIDKIVLTTPKMWEDTDVSEADVAIHIMTENGYFHNAVCDQRLVDEECVKFFFPVTREMTCKSGKLKVEFSFSDAALPFSFTSRTTELLIGDSLTDGEEIESDYSGLLWDVMGRVEGFSSRLESTESSVAELENAADDINEIKGLIGYTDEDVLGLEADFENSVFNRLAGARELEAGADFDAFGMYQRRRCNVSDDGSIVAYYGDDNYRDDGTNGQVMVYQPKFYYRVVPIKLEKQEGAGYHVRKANYYISSAPKPLFKLHPAFYNEDGKEVDYILYSAYEGCVSDNALSSVSGAKPTGSYTRSEFEAFAKARGNGWHIETIQALAANQLLMAIEYATFNMQSAIGLGVVNLSADTSVNRSCITGATADLGNTSGEASETVGEVGGVQTVYTEGGKLSVSYRGVENPWGNIFKFANGIAILGYGENGDSAKVCNGFSFNDSASTSAYAGVGFSVAKTGGYVQGFGFGDEKFDWIFLPTYSEGFAATSAYPVGDSLTPEKNAYTGVRNFFYGGNWTNAEQNGPFRYHIKNSTAGKYTFCGARLMFVGEALI